MLLQRCHRVPHITSSRLDVIRVRSAHVRVTQDALNHDLRHTQAVEVAAQSAPCSSSPSASCRITGTGARPLCVFGAVTCPFQIERDTYISPSWKFSHSSP